MRRNKYADLGDEEEEELEEHGDEIGGEKNNIKVRESFGNDPSSNIFPRVAHLPQEPSRTIVYYLTTNTSVWTWSLRLLVSNRPQRCTVGLCCLEAPLRLPACTL